MNRQRADLLLVNRGLFDSRAQAQAAITAGLVTANGAVVRKASENLPADARIVAEKPHPFVSRGGVKLAAALEAFGIDPKGRFCLDVGASTGGFTDLLLQRGARHVAAVDTGRGQLHERIAQDRRVTSLEATDIRTLAAGGLPEAPTLAVIDVSFISLAKVLPAVSALLAPAAELVALIKPQFEVGKAQIGKGGLVKDEAAREAAVAAILDALRDLGWRPAQVIDSPISGGDGNREYLVAASR